MSQEISGFSPATKNVCKNPNAPVLFLFDVDGTLSPSQRPVTADCRKLLRRLASSKATGNRTILTGVISGSDAVKVCRQFGVNDKTDLVQVEFPDSPGLDYLFFENGLMAYKADDGIATSASLSEVAEKRRRDISTLGEESLVKVLGEEKLQELMNFVLKEFSSITLPKKRGNFVELRTSNLNVSPIGRACSIAEREEFAALDQKEGIRRQLLDKLNEEFGSWGMDFAAGGQISIDCFPKGWDKGYALKFLESEFSAIYFFGDKCIPGGNDYQIFKHSAVNGYQVSDPETTVRKASEVLAEIMGEI